MITAALVYMPVIHAGYLAWIDAQESLGHDVYLIHEEFADEIDIRRKDLRALPSVSIATLLGRTKVFSRTNAESVLMRYDRFVFADEDISDHVIEELFSDCRVERANVFLRYDRKKSAAKEEVTPDRIVSDDPVVRAIMEQVAYQGKKSSDWYLQVGAGLVRNGALVMLGHNEHVPNPNIVDALGSVRANWKQGVHIDLSTALHAEGFLFAEALRRGISFSGADLFVSTFPCPYCAPIIANSGIRSLYFMNGYSMIEGQKLFREKCIEIVHVV